QSDNDFYYTDAISEQAVTYLSEHMRNHANEPFFHYVAYTAPHWPLHAPEKEVEKYKGRFDKGWDVLRSERLKQMKDRGLIDIGWQLTDRDPTQEAWENVKDKEWLTKCMEVYAAQIDRMDQGIGSIIDTLKEHDQLDNTMILFLSDNGGCAEVITPEFGAHLVKGKSARVKTRTGDLVQFGNQRETIPGPENTYQSYGIGWANLSNTPFRLYKHWVHEGGIATPLIVHWPDGIARSGLRHSYGQLTDIMATIIDITGATYPSVFKGHDILPYEGTSLKNIFEKDIEICPPLFWEHEGNAAVRLGKWKLVKRYPGDWELYDMSEDRTETDDLAACFPERVSDMAQLYEEWSERCGVIPRENILSMMNRE